MRTYSQTLLSQLDKKHKRAVNDMRWMIAKWQWDKATKPGQFRRHFYKIDRPTCLSLLAIANYVHLETRSLSRDLSRQVVDDLVLVTNLNHRLNSHFSSSMHAPWQTADDRRVCLGSLGHAYLHDRPKPHILAWHAAQLMYRQRRSNGRRRRNFCLSQPDCSGCGHSTVLSVTQMSRHEGRCELRSACGWSQVGRRCQQGNTTNWFNWKCAAKFFVKHPFIIVITLCWKISVPWLGVP
jgi:hypothetical protein